MDVADEEAENATRSMTDVTGHALRRLAPDSGAYFNEVRRSCAFRQGFKLTL